MALFSLVAQAQAAPVDDLLDSMEDAAQTAAPTDLPAGTTLLRNVSYGQDPAQRMDIYVPPRARAAPVLLMVHGGGWRAGDKAMHAVIDNKAARWLPRGFIFISVNYRLLPAANLMQQAQDVATALAVAQSKAAGFGGDADKFVLLGHSAGAHLVALLNAAPKLAFAQGAKPWLGTISLDSAALDVASIMRGRHLPLYDRAFGKDPLQWAALSPLDQLTAASPPLLAVCSSRRALSCPNAQAFVDKAVHLGLKAQLHKENLTHRDINQTLGLPSALTSAVESFMAGLNPALRAALATPQ